MHSSDSMIASSTLLTAPLSLPKAQSTKLKALVDISQNITCCAIMNSAPQCLDTCSAAPPTLR